MNNKTLPLNPGHGKAGRKPTRQILDTLSGHEDPGMFGRMFPKLPALDVPDKHLQDLADAMKDSIPVKRQETMTMSPLALHTSVSLSITTLLSTSLPLARRKETR